MAKVVVQVGALTVLVKDDRAVLKGAALREWKSAVTEIIEGVSATLGDVEEEVEDGG